MSGSGGGDNKNNTENSVKKCGLTEVVIFLLAILAGTACSICSKTMMELRSVGITGEVEIFQKPIFQTFGMFVGMIFGIVMHWLVVFFKIPFPGYEHANSSSKKDALFNNDDTGAKNNRNHHYGSIGGNGTEEEKESFLSQDNNANGTTNQASTGIPTWMYFFLAIPSIFDLGATVLCMMGLQYIDVSIYQLLRGSGQSIDDQWRLDGQTPFIFCNVPITRNQPHFLFFLVPFSILGIIFVALMKQHVLGDHLFVFQWIGVVWNVVSVFFVGAVAILNEQAGQGGEQQDLDATSTTQAGQALLGVLLVMAGAVVQAMQFVFEEKVMTMDIPSPPLLLIGMEGIWGTLLCVLIVYPLAYYLPGDDHGSYEDPFNTMEMFYNSKTIQYAFAIYFFVIFSYNFLAVLVTFALNSVWHAILDNFRPIVSFALAPAIILEISNIIVGALVFAPDCMDDIALHILFHNCIWRLW